MSDRATIKLYVNQTEYVDWEDSTQIERNTAILMHEIGHALKLAHPTDIGTGNKDTPSVMQTEGVTGANFVHRITNYDKSALIHKWGEANE